MHEPTFASLEFVQKQRETRREQLLARIEGLLAKLAAVAGPHYPRPGRGRRPQPLAAMPRVHVVQVCCNPRLWRPLRNSAWSWIMTGIGSDRRSGGGDASSSGTARFGRGLVGGFVWTRPASGGH